jgi:hypothetical protein
MKKKGKITPTIYHTQEGHANNYTTDDVLHGKCDLFSTSKYFLIGWFMMFNATFNNISDISWRSV